jgi:hypothetical protein
MNSAPMPSWSPPPVNPVARDWSVSMNARWLNVRNPEAELFIR